MRMLVVIVFVIGAAEVIGQSAEDSILFNLINDFRIEEGRKALNWDPQAYLAAKYQADYLQEIQELTHSQRKNIPNHREINNHFDRIRHFKTSGYLSATGECVYGDNYADANDANTTARSTFFSWKNSPGHRDIMLGNYAYGACIIAMKSKKRDVNANRRYASDNEYKVRSVLLVYR